MEFVIENLLGPVIAAALTALYLRGVAAPGEVNRHDSQAAELNEDLRRFVRDHNRIVAEQIIDAHAEVESLGGVEAIERKLRSEGKGLKIDLGGAAVKARGEALHVYRDEASRKLRQFRELGDREGWTHRLVRRWHSQPAPHLVLPADCRKILAVWREPVPSTADPDKSTPVEDVTAPDLEPELADLESDAGARWRAG
jgi:hypothetical protein